MSKRESATIDTWKNKSPIISKRNDRIRLIKNKAEYRECSFCGKKINMDEGTITVNYRFWLHAGCVEDFCKEILKFKEENKTVLILGSL